MAKDKVASTSELLVWIRNCLIVHAGILPEIPNNFLSTNYPSKVEDYPKAFDWWLYNAFESSCAFSGTPLSFSGILHCHKGNLQCDPYEILFGFRHGDDDDFDEDFLKEDFEETFEDHLERLLYAYDRSLKRDQDAKGPTTLVCPECASPEVTTEHHQAFMVNTGKHYCHNMKTQDHDSPAHCLQCDWRGQRHQLEVLVPKPKPPKETNRYCAIGMCVATDKVHSENCPTRKGISHHG